VSTPSKSDRSDISDGAPRVIPPSGGYRKLRSFQAAQLVYDATVVFCDRFVDKRSRTHDQMVQPCARRGLTQKQVAEMLGTKQQAIARLEDPAYSGHSLSMVRK
jgi:hypothetical protein